jgi:hypothetical protein
MKIPNETSKCLSSKFDKQEMNFLLANLIK